MLVFCKFFVISSIKAERVRIYKFNMFKALTDSVSEIYNDKTKKNAELLEAIRKNIETKRVNE